MEFERWIRYLVPGYVALAPLIFAIPFLANKHQTMQTPLIAALIALGPAAGFLVHQVHMLFHEWFYLAKKKRPIIKFIMTRCGMTELHNNEATLKATAREALIAWNYFFHDSKTIGEGLRDHISRSWYFIHSFCSTGWAFLFGLGCLALVLFKVYPSHLEPNSDAIFIRTWWFRFVFVYVVGCFFSFLKAKSTRKYMERFEEFVAYRHRESIGKILANILEHRLGKPIRRSEATNTETAQPVSSADG